MSIIKELTSLKTIVSNSGLTCLYLNGGKKDANYGQAFLIGDSKGLRKKAIYIPKNPKPNRGLALIPIQVNDIVVDYKKRQENEFIYIYKIISIDKTELDGTIASLETIHKYSTIDGGWIDKDDSSIARYVPVEYEDILKSASNAAATENCIVPFFITEDSFKK